MIPYMIALYIRLSVEDSYTESLSISHQRLLLREKAMTLPEYECSEIREFIDNGYSGMNFERPAVQELLQKVQEGVVRCIIVKDLSRLGRSSIETGFFVERVFPLYHTRFISISDGYDSALLKGDTGGISATFRYLMNECYSRDMSAKIRSAKYAKMRRGEYQSVICPYGYQKSADGRMEPEKETAETVHKIFEWAAEGNSCAAIARKLHSLQIPTPSEQKVMHGRGAYDVSRTNGAWCTTTILRILRDERYIGTYVIGKRRVCEIGSNRTKPKPKSEWYRIPDHHPAIVSKELFAQANQAIPHYTIASKSEHPYLLRGIVVCGCCGHVMARKRTPPWFFCRFSENAASLPCHKARIRASDVEQTVFQMLKAHISAELDDIEAAEKPILPDFQEAETATAIDCLISEKRQLYEQYTLGKISLETYLMKKSTYDEALTRERNIQAAVSMQKAFGEHESRLRKERSEHRARLVKANCLTDELVATFIRKVYVYPDQHIEIEYANEDSLAQES